MDRADVISYLAQAEARRVRPVRYGEAAAGGLPFFEFARDVQSGRLVVRGHGHGGHDNEGRMPLLCDWLSARVLPLLDGDAVRALAGRCLRLELHDSYSYLPARRLRPGLYENALTFARPRGARESVALLPDPYQMLDYSGLLAAAARDPVPWAQKSAVALFAGSTTGDRDPTRNARIRAALWALDQPADAVRVRITSIVQMEPRAALSAVPRLEQALSAPVPLEEHWQHRYVLNLSGNTACWSRVPMVLASRSLLLDVRGEDERDDDMVWYAPALREGEHYVAARGLAGVLPARARCEADPAGCQAIVERARRFAADFLPSAAAAAYASQLLQECAWLSAP